ncbi:flagellar protein FliT [Bacillus infantis]|uniref:flagellar protein FliT n=1 Tax=Bacillus infantis TaxID=324767 RepID=UPI001CD668D9|nr:flagellar protein FliT [Bacillus infantis]MCA1040466.1 flagellar protein FliT [Bacillus infantis]
MSSVERLYALTVGLVDRLEQGSDRDEKIGWIEAALEERDQLMQELQPPYSEGEKALGKKLLDLNIRLSQLLQKEKALIQKDIKGLSIKKESNNKYVNPYQSMATDGMFYDKRK